MTESLLKSYIRKSKSIVVLHGAGVSVSCGGSVFRGKNGIRADANVRELFNYTKSADLCKRALEFLNLFPNVNNPTKYHFWLKSLNDAGVLKHVYTMNIDSLERKCLPDTKITFLHGEASKLKCEYCNKKKNLTKKWIAHIQKGWKIKCSCRRRSSEKRLIKAAVYRTDVVLYNEPSYSCDVMIPNNVDCLLVVGCSLSSTVTGTASLLSSFKDIPIFFVNPDAPPKRYSHFIHVPICSDDLSNIEVITNQTQSSFFCIDFEYWKGLIKSTYKKKYFTIGNLWNLVEPKKRTEIHNLLDHLVQISFLQKNLHRYKVNYI